MEDIPCLLTGFWCWYYFLSEAREYREAPRACQAKTAFVKTAFGTTVTVCDKARTPGHANETSLSMEYILQKKYFNDIIREKRLGVPGKQRNV
jgi:hypothetical protein